MHRLFLLPLLLLLVATVPNAQDQADAGLKRSGLVVTVKLEDAKGRPLVVRRGEVASLFLWRVCGDYHRSAYAWYDWQNSRVVCGGYGDRGIEPGEYVLEGSPGGYGPFRVNFTLTRNGTLEYSHRFEVWRRVITLSFVDPAGKPLKEIASPPQYQAGWQQVEGFKTRHLVGALRAHPGQSRFRTGKGFSRDNPEPEQQPQKYAMDGGKWYIAVLAGADGRLRAGGQVWEGDFKGKEWDSPIEVELQLDEAVKKRPLANKDDPGNRSLLGVAEKDRINISFKLGHDLLRPELDVPAEWQRNGNTWTAAVPPGARPRWRLTGGPLFCLPWKALPRADADGSVNVSYTTQHPEIAVSAATATMREWWDFGHAGHADYDVESTMYQPIGDERRLRTLVGDTELAEILSRGELCLVAGGGYSQEWSEAIVIHGNPPQRKAAQALRIGGDGVTLSGVVKLNAAQKTALKSKRLLELEVPFTGVSFRGVTAEGSGLPAVCASIFPLSDEKTALRLKQVETDLAARDERPNIVFIPKDAAESLLGADKSTSDADLKEWMGEDVFNALPDRECRLRFGRFGAWYDTRRVVKSDEHGYVLNNKIELKPGTKYVMYVWGGSRDDLKPDARVEFTYDGKAVDLGAIVLPDYTKSAD